MSLCLLIYFNYVINRKSEAQKDYNNVIIMVVVGREVSGGVILDKYSPESMYIMSLHVSVEAKIGGGWQNAAIPGEPFIAMVNKNKKAKTQTSISNNFVIILMTFYIYVINWVTSLTAKVQENV